MFLKNKLPKIAIVGATGAVGTELLTLMNERGFEYQSLELVASKRSAGKTIKYRGRDHVVHDLEHFDFSTVDIAFFSAGTGTSKIWAGRAAAAGALVIDNTNAFRMDPLSPLVVPQVNAHMLASRPESGVIANPNCSTIQMVRALAPIERLFGIKQVVVSTYQAASGGGLTGMEQLQADAAAHLAGAEPVEVTRFPKPLAFNVVPQVDVLMPTGFTLEEQKMVQESRKILERPALRLTATAVRVPVLNGHSEAVYVECVRPVDRAALLQALKDAPELIVADSLEGADYATPRFMSSPNHVHVGRVRVNPDNPNGVWLWIVADNLRIGAALNAIQIAEVLVKEAV